MAHRVAETEPEQEQSGPQIGERWAYRARANDPLVEVEVARIGVKKPTRLLVRFMDEEFEGLRDWVPPARLKVPWSDVEEYRAREARWDRVYASSPERESIEEEGAQKVFDLVIDDGHATLDYRSDGVTRIHDVGGLAAKLQIGPDLLRSNPASFDEDGDIIVPWPTTLLIAKRAAELDPQPILESVDRDEAKARREAVHGWYTGGRNGHWVEPEFCIQWDEGHRKPVRAMLREWCGVEAVGLREELASLRYEVRRLTGIVEVAVDELRGASAARPADRIERALSDSQFDPQLSSRAPARNRRRTT